MKFPVHKQCNFQELAYIQKMAKCVLTTSMHPLAAKVNRYFSGNQGAYNSRTGLHNPHLNLSVN